MAYSFRGWMSKTCAFVSDGLQMLGYRQAHGDVQIPSPVGLVQPLFILGAKGFVPALQTAVDHSLEPYQTKGGGEQSEFAAVQLFQFCLGDQNTLSQSHVAKLWAYGPEPVGKGVKKGAEGGAALEANTFVPQSLFGDQALSLLQRCFAAAR